MYEMKSIEEITTDFAKKIKQERLRQNKTQEEFSLKAGVKLSTYKTFENKAKGTFENFLLILKAFGKINELESILSKPEFSPKEQITKNSKQEKQRVKHKIKTSSKTKHLESSTSGSIISNIISKKKDIHDK